LPPVPAPAGSPYYQLFCGEEFFQHQLKFDHSSLTRWRQRMEEERLTALIQESLAVATRTGAAKPADSSKVIVDTTVQPKAVAFPTDAKLMHRARERLVKLAKKTSVGLRQSYERVGKHALIASEPPRRQRNTSGVDSQSNELFS
jgi:transposase, IS5 family